MKPKVEQNLEGGVFIHWVQTAWCLTMLGSKDMQVYVVESSPVPGIEETQCSAGQGLQASEIFALTSLTIEYYLGLTVQRVSQS